MKNNDIFTGQPLSQREFLRPKEVPLLFPMSRSYLYQMIEEQKVHSLCIRKKGNRRGMRWVSVDSLKEFFKGYASNDEEVPQ